jgi:amino acid adenylation domain-containing protein
MAAAVGMIAALRSGAAWAVVEPGQPGARLDSLLDRTDCAAIVHSGQAPAGDRLPVLIDYATSGAPDACEVPADGRHPAYLVFTSGTTGQPKAVVISRANLDAAIAGRVESYGPAPICLSAMSVSFDGLIGTLFAALAGGGTLVVPDARQLRDPVAVAELAARHRVTHIDAVPSFYQLLLDQAELLPSSVTTVALGGEVVPPALVERHRTALPQARLLNEYGPTETTISCTLHPIAGTPKRTVPIGRPLHGATAQVLDERLRPVPQGQIGELYVGGDYVGLGYAGAPGDTAERFVADPRRRGGRMYRTGDLVTVGQTGELAFHGRVDDQVKVRGVRVELGEIEHVLRRHHSVRQAVVIRDDDSIAAFVVGTASSVELRAHCTEYLIEQAIPATFVTVAQIPLTHNGKTDREALRSLVPVTAGAVPARPGWTATHHAVATEWATVLRHHDAGLADRFWQVGGTSLKLMDLYERLDARWPGLLRVGELFELDTIGAQADAIASRAANDRAGDRPGGNRAQPPSPMFRLEV